MLGNRSRKGARVPLYPYDRDGAGIFFYSHGRPASTQEKDGAGALDVRGNSRVATAGILDVRGNSRPTTPDSQRPRSAYSLGVAQRPRSAGSAGRRQMMTRSNVQQEEWNSRHHISASTHNARLPPCLRNYFDIDRYHLQMKCEESIVCDESFVLPVHEYTTPPKILYVTNQNQNDAINGAPNAQLEIAELIDAEVGGEKPAEATRRSSGRTRRSTFRRSITREDVLQRRQLESQVKELYESAELVPHLRPFADFYLWAIQKFRNLTRCWRMLDTNLNMMLHSNEFLTGLRKYEYPGDARFMFKVLDRDHSGTLLYYHFDPCGADDLATLVEWCTSKFGSVKTAFRELDKDRSGSITVAELQTSTKEHGFHCQRAIACVFEMLDLDSDRKVTPSELEFLDQWKCPPWLKAEPDDRAAAEFKRKIVKKHGGNSIRAWHLGIDLDHSMRVSWDEFFKASSAWHFNKSKAAAVWRSIDKNLSGWLSFREFDEPGGNLLLRFRNYCADKYGGIAPAFQEIGQGRSRWKRKEFEVIVEDLELNDEEADALFNGLDLQGKGSISMSALKYLENWNTDEESKDEEFWQIITKSLLAKQSQDQMDKEDGMP